MSNVEPTIRDYPDFMVPNGAASFALADEVLTNNGDVIFGPFDVSSWPVLNMYAGVDISAAFTSLRCDITWFSDINGGAGIPVRTVTFAVPANGQLTLSLPNYGSRVVVEFIPTGLVGTLSVYMNLTAIGSTTPSGGGSLDFCTPIAEVNQMIGAGGTVTATTNLITHGWMMLVIGTAGTGLVDAAVNFLDTLGNLHGLIGLSCPAGTFQVSMLFRMPPLSIRLTVTNRGAGAQPCYAAVNASQ